MKEQDTGMDQNEAVNSVCSRRRCTHETVSRKDLAFGLCCAIQDAEHRQKAYSRSMLTKTPAPWPGSLCRRYAPSLPHKTYCLRWQTGRGGQNEDHAKPDFKRWATLGFWRLMSVDLQHSGAWELAKKGDTSVFL